MMTVSRCRCRRRRRRGDGQKGMTCRHNAKADDQHVLAE
jgi:hypothetical protein